MGDYWTDAVAATKASIADKTDQKEQIKQAGAVGEQQEYSAWVTYNKVKGQKEHLEDCKRSLERQKQDLEFEMKMAISRATMQGKSSKEIDEIKASYQGRIDQLSGSIMSSSASGKSIDELVEQASKDYSAARFFNIANDNLLINILHSLFDLFLQNGKYEQAQMVYDHMQKSRGLDVDA